MQIIYIRYNDNREEKKLIYLKNMDLRFLEIIVFMSAICSFNICQYSMRFKQKILLVFGF